MLGKRVMLTAMGPYEDRFRTSGLSISLHSRIALRKASGEGCVRAVRMPSPPALDTELASLGRPTHCMPPCTTGMLKPSFVVSSVVIVILRWVCGELLMVDKSEVVLYVPPFSVLERLHHTYT